MQMNTAHYPDKLKTMRKQTSAAERTGKQALSQKDKETDRQAVAKVEDK